MDEPGVLTASPAPATIPRASKTGANAAAGMDTVGARVAGTGGTGAGAGGIGAGGIGPGATGTSTALAVRIGVTGHTDLSLDTIRLVARAVREHLRQVRDRARERSQVVVGVSCLAPGADCVFARVLLGLGGRLEAIIPSDDYRESQTTVLPRFAPIFDDLVRQADIVRRTGWIEAQPRAFAAANDVMLASIDELVAVWDGEQSTVLGGTAHAVGVARSQGIPVTVIWPPGARRG